MPERPVKTGLLADLFCGIGNTFWDFARIASGLLISSVIILALYRTHLGQVPTLAELSDAGLKTFVGCMALIGGKDIARNIATKGAG